MVREGRTSQDKGYVRGILAKSYKRASVKKEDTLKEPVPKMVEVKRITQIREAC